MEWNFRLGSNCNMNMGYLWPFSFQNHLGVIWCTCLMIACTLKTAGVEWNGVKFGLGVVVDMYMGWLFSSQGHFGVIWCTCLKMTFYLTALLTAAWRAKLSEFWDLEYICGIPFTVSGHFWFILCTCLKMARNSKTLMGRIKVLIHVILPRRIFSWCANTLQFVRGCLKAL